MPPVRTRPVGRPSRTVPPYPLDLYNAHLVQWSGGCGAAECQRAQFLVFFRGALPSDVLFIGEAPGKSEDVKGIPFYGPAGMLLDRIIRKAWGKPGPTGKPRWTYGLTNLVCCIPRGEDGAKTHEPSDEQILACQPRLAQMLEICNPRLVVAVGRVANDWLDPTYRSSLKLPPGVGLIDIVHPAAILRANQTTQGLMEQRAVVTLQNALEELA